MGFAAVRWASQLTHTPGGAPLQGAAKLALLCIANHVQDDTGDQAYPKRSTIATWMGTSPRHATSMVAWLKNEGMLLVEEQAGGSRKMPDGQRPNLYSLPGYAKTLEGWKTSSTVGGNTSSTVGGTCLPPKKDLEEGSIKTSKERPVAPLPGEFEDFWGAYPKRTGKLAAEKAYIRARRTTTAELILQGARKMRNQAKGMDQKFVPHPATWLNAGRWLDEDAPRPGASRMLGGHRIEAGVM